MRIIIKHLQVQEGIQLNYIQNDVWMTGPDGQIVKDGQIFEEANAVIYKQYSDDGFISDPIHAIPQFVMKYLNDSGVYKPGMKYWKMITK